MGYKTLSLTLLSSKDLTGKTYVSISISGCPRTKKPTPIDRGGGRSPTLVFTFDEAEDGYCTVVFKAMKRRVFGWDKVVGEVRVAVKELLGGKERRTATCEVRRKDKVVGELEVEYMAADAAVVVVQRRDDEDDDGYYDPRAADYDF